MRIFVLERDELATVPHVRSESTDVGRDLLALGRLAQVARQIEQLERLVEFDLVHLLSRPQAGELRLFLIVARADLHEGTVTSHAHRDRLARLGVGAEFACLDRLVAAYGLLLVAHQGIEARPELAHDRYPVLLTARHLVQLVLEPGGKVVVHVAGEVLGEKAVDHFADVGRVETPVGELDILALNQRRDDVGVRRRPADAVRLQDLHEARLGVTRWRFGEMLFGAHGLEGDLLAFLQGRQAAVAVVAVVAVVAALLVDAYKAREDDRGTGGAKAILAGTRGQVDSHLVIQRLRHLRGDRPLPDQVVEAKLVVVQESPHGPRFTGDGRGTNGFVSLLGVLGLVAKHPWRCRQVVVAVLVGDEPAHLLHRLAGQYHGIGSHVGDQAHAGAVDLDALVKLLGNTHGALGAETELAGRFLLQCRGDERWRRIATTLLAFDLFHQQPALRVAFELLAHGVGARLVGNVELLEFFPVEMGELGGESLVVGAEIRLDGPVLANDKPLDFVLAFADQPQRRTLDPTGRQSAANLLPQQGREVESHQVIEGAPRLLGIDQRGRQLAGIIHRFLDRALGDLVKYHAVDGLAVEHAAVAQQLVEVPGNRLALPIRVRGEVQGIGFLGGAGDLVDVLLVALDEGIVHREVLVWLHCAALREQVPDVTVGRQGLEFLAEILAESTRLGGGLDDNKVVGHVSGCTLTPRRSGRGARHVSERPGERPRT